MSQGWVERMTVGDLKRRLADMPDDLPIYSEADWDWLHDVQLGEGPRESRPGDTSTSHWDVPAVVLQ